jgi:hypothetical protein
MIDHALTQMDSDNDDMTDDENDDPVAAHDEIGDLAFILVLTVLGQTEDRSKSPAPGSMVTETTHHTDQSSTTYS